MSVTFERSRISRSSYVYLDGRFSGNLDTRRRVFNTARKLTHSELREIQESILNFFTVKVDVVDAWS